VTTAAKTHQNNISQQISKQCTGNSCQWWQPPTSQCDLLWQLVSNCSKTNTVSGKKWTMQHIAISTKTCQICLKISWQNYRHHDMSECVSLLVDTVSRHCRQAMPYFRLMSASILLVGGCGPPTLCQNDDSHCWQGMSVNNVSQQWQ